jgi:hypothetical protein
MGGFRTTAVRVVVAMVAIGGIPKAVISVAQRSAPHTLTAARAEPVMAGTVPTLPSTTTTTVLPAPAPTVPPVPSTIAPAPARVVKKAAAAPATPQVPSRAQAQADQVAFDRSPQDVGREALSMISYPWQSRLNVSINFEGPKSGMKASSTAYGDHEVITVYVRSTDTARIVAVNIAHELGHLIDYRHLNDQDRAEWLQARGRTDAPWWTCDYCTDYRFGSGDFAETFAGWQVGPVDYRSELAPYPSPEQMQQLTRFFD